MKRQAVIVLDAFEGHSHAKFIGNYFRKLGVKPIIVNVEWSECTISDCVNKIVRRCKAQAGDRTYLFGFSLGAAVALIASTIIKPAGQLICSLSPCFSEDLPHLSESQKAHFTDEQLQDMKSLSFDSISCLVTCPTLLTVGSDELSILKHRVNEASMKIPHSKVIIVKGANHDIGSTNYSSVIETLVKELVAKTRLSYSGAA